MRQEKEYRKTPVRATFYAIHGSRRVRIQDATLQAVLLRLRELCPGGTFRDLWEGKTC